jgi:hypothetical protein
MDRAKLTIYNWKSWAQQLSAQPQNNNKHFLLWNIQLVYSIIKQIRRAENKNVYKKSICTAMFYFYFVYFP